VGVTDIQTATVMNLTRSPTCQSFQGFQSKSGTCASGPTNASQVLLADIFRDELAATATNVRSVFENTEVVYVGENWMTLVCSKMSKGCTLNN
jgi:hypothetical protein